ncbi:MAG: helix-turn-helix transcriptional regulator [Henriciella sp.]
MQNGDVWRALDTIATRNGLSPSGLAKLAGLDATAFNKSKRISKEGRPRWPSTESIARALMATGVDYVEFAVLVSGHSSLTMPVIEFPDASGDDLFSETGIPTSSRWDQAEFPSSEFDESCFALEIVGTGFEPAFRAGDRIIASRRTELRRHDRVIVKTTDRSLHLGAIARQTTQKLELRPLVGREPISSLETNQIDWVARILWASQ